jgi:hypothetical protein
LEWRKARAIEDGLNLSFQQEDERYKKEHNNSVPKRRRRRRRTSVVWAIRRQMARASTAEPTCLLLLSGHLPGNS